MAHRKQNKLYLLTVCIFLAGIISEASPIPTSTPNPTPDYWKCENRVSGVWSFGTAPSACDANSFGEDDHIWKTYDILVFDEKKDPDEERTRYMEEMAAVIQEAATRYIKSRKPDIDGPELEAFVRASFTMAHQESFWSHYRHDPTHVLKMMRGDYGHGHGLMQVDDRWHFIAVTHGTAWNVILNVIYSLEEYFYNWEAAPSAPCLTDPADFRSRARSAYSAYNGGTSKICRWTNPEDKWARNDVGFITKYDQERWKPFIKNPNKKSRINVACLIEGQENCPKRSDGSQSPTPTRGQIYQSPMAQHCVFTDSFFECVENTRDLTCLQRYGKVADERSIPMPAAFEKIPKKIIDRHDLCLRRVKLSIYPIGTKLKVQKDIYLRATPAGLPIDVVPRGAAVEVLDFEVRDHRLAKRYYQVRWGGRWGYAYGGDLTDHSQWMINSDLVVPQSLIASAGQEVLIKAKDGVQLRAAIGGEVKSQVPEGAKLSVKTVYPVGEANEIYYRVEFQGQVGLIYAGRSLPQKTFSAWMVPISE